MYSLLIADHFQNILISAHNIALEEKVYGETLYLELCNLCNSQHIEEEDIDRIFILSLEWPAEI